MTVFQASCPGCIQAAGSLRQEAVLSSLCILSAFTSGADALEGSLASLPLSSESEELSEPLVLPDSELLECADATILGWDCWALQSHHEIKLESSTGEVSYYSDMARFKNETETPCFGTERRKDKAKECSAMLKR